MGKPGLWAAIGAGALAVLGALLLAGCGTVGYLVQSVHGHLSLVQQARPVEQWLADANTPQHLRERLALSQRIRRFAVDELGLPDTRSYRSYADLGRPAAVWNVVAVPELSLTLQTWCFPVVGCVGYRGYYDRKEAEAFAQTLRAQGMDVRVYGVPAYSTLGRLEWLGGDPLLNTFIGYPEGELARLIFHELAHHVVYVRDDTSFNESFATAVERLGVQRWLQHHASAAAKEEYERFDARRRDFLALTLRYRERLAAVYAGPGREEDKRRGKAEVLAAMRAEHAQLKAGPWEGFAGYDRWFEEANGASLAVLAAYTEWVPGFERLFEAQGRSFARFYEAVRELAQQPRDERRRVLMSSMISDQEPAR
ncbi:MAG: aminopeptidase [Caldimonas manganoxidans]|nr:aminopeptidase [Caldimonas manganoxidans]